MSDSESDDDQGNGSPSSYYHDHNGFPDGSPSRKPCPAGSDASDFEVDLRGAGESLHAPSLYEHRGAFKPPLQSPLGPARGPFHLQHYSEANWAFHGAAEGFIADEIETALACHAEQSISWSQINNEALRQLMAAEPLPGKQKDDENAAAAAQGIGIGNQLGRLSPTEDPAVHQPGDVDGDHVATKRRKHIHAQRPVGAVPTIAEGQQIGFLTVRPTVADLEQLNGCQQLQQRTAVRRLLC